MTDEDQQILIESLRARGNDDIEAQSAADEIERLAGLIYDAHKWLEGAIESLDFSGAEDTLGTFRDGH